MREILENLTVGASATLLTLWACGTLLSWPFVGDTNVFLLLPLFLRWPQRGAWPTKDAVWRYVFFAALVVWLLALLAAVVLVEDTVLKAFIHSAYYVIPMWCFGFLVIVRPRVMPANHSFNATVTGRGESPSPRAAH
jgi:hypothetical protein